MSAFGFNKTQTLKVLQSPAVIVGSGIAGLLTALKLAEKGVASVVVSKTHLTENSSRMAQGGIAAVLPQNTEDSLQLHLDDTLKAGAGLCNKIKARSILKEGAQAIDDLIDLGVAFDREPDGEIAMGMEGAHSVRRIVHAGGDATGKSVQDTLIERVLENPLITVIEQCFVKNLFVEDTVCQGVYGVQTTNKGQYLKSHQWIAIFAEHVILATGGVGQLYIHTTNPRVSTGDGVALAYQAGATVEDVEFVQFHPTGFWTPNGLQFLISEAVRGEGGILRNKEGVAFAKERHPNGELAPRDELTRLIWDEMAATEQPCVFLDVTHLSKEKLQERFPSIKRQCATYGVDIEKDWIPVAPAAHYWMGGVKTDAHGQSTLKGLYAVGEAASTGLHGANRLASNSLLECLVLARRVAQMVFSETEKEKTPKKPNAGHRQLLAENLAQKIPNLHTNASHLLFAPIWQLKVLMAQHVGIIREHVSLQQALVQLKQMQAYAEEEGFFDIYPEGFELQNMLLTAMLITQAALERKESRGAHYRKDYPEKKAKAQHSLLNIYQQNELSDSLQLPTEDDEVLSSDEKQEAKAQTKSTRKKVSKN